ncbi:MAG: FmdB family zinc ribbon protein [Spirochaetia bacterium]
MPIFEYTCKKCGKESELLIRRDEKPVCEHCGSSAVTKKFSSFAVSIGSGKAPECAGSCGEGFTRGACGSGMCCGGKD